MAVIVILAILMTVGGFSVFHVIDESKKKLLEEQVKVLSDTAITFVQKSYFDVCPSTFNPKNPTTSLKNKCYREVSVKQLVEAEMFENKNDLCKLDQRIVIYRYNAGGYSELRSFIPEGTCEY